MTHQILKGQFNPKGRVLLIGTKTGDRMVLADGLKEWAMTPTGPAYCTAKRHNGPLFDRSGVCVSGHDLIAVNYVEGEE